MSVPSKKRKPSSSTKPSKKNYSRISLSQSNNKQNNIVNATDKDDYKTDNDKSRTRTISSVTKKRLVIDVEVLNPYNVFKKEINKKCHYFEYLCCGAWNCCCCKSYCACCCICFSEYDIIKKVGTKISKQLNEKGIENSLIMTCDKKPNSFSIEVRGRSMVTQMMGSLVIDKLIKNKLNAKGVKANVSCDRKEVQVEVINEE